MQAQDVFICSYTTQYGKVVTIIRRGDLYDVDHTSVGNDTVSVSTFPRFIGLASEIHGETIVWNSGSTWTNDQDSSTSACRTARFRSHQRCGDGGVAGEVQMDAGGDVELIKAIVDRSDVDDVSDVDIAIGLRAALRQAGIAKPNVKHECDELWAYLEKQ